MIFIFESSFSWNTVTHFIPHLRPHAAVVYPLPFCPMDDGRVHPYTCSCSSSQNPRYRVPDLPSSSAISGLLVDTSSPHSSSSSRFDLRRRRHSHLRQSAGVLNMGWWGSGHTVDTNACRGRHAGGEGGGRGSGLGEGLACLGADAGIGCAALGI